MRYPAAGDESISFVMLG